MPSLTVAKLCLMWKQNKGSISPVLCCIFHSVCFCETTRGYNNGQVLPSISISHTVYLSRDRQTSVSSYKTSRLSCTIAIKRGTEFGPTILLDTFATAPLLSLPSLPVNYLVFLYRGKAHINPLRTISYSDFSPLFLQTRRCRFAVSCCIDIKCPC